MKNKQRIVIVLIVMLAAVTVMLGGSAYAQPNRKGMTAAQGKVARNAIHRDREGRRDRREDVRDHMTPEERRRLKYFKDKQKGESEDAPRHLTPEERRRLKHFKDTHKDKFEDVRGRKEDVRDRREDIRDHTEDIRDRRNEKDDYDEKPELKAIDTDQVSVTQDVNAVAVDTTETAE